MSRSHIAKWLRDRVAEAARHRCGYCLSAERVVGARMEIDHIIPRSAGGLTEEDNLWLACSLCNDHKSDRIAATDPLTGALVPLFDPRHQVWGGHFRWNAAGDTIVGTTPSGRATVVALALNRASLLVARRLWIEAGWHPPED